MARRWPFLPRRPNVCTLWPSQPERASDELWQLSRRHVQLVTRCIARQQQKGSFDSRPARLGWVSRCRSPRGMVSGLPPPTLEPRWDRALVRLASAANVGLSHHKEPAKWRIWISLWLRSLFVPWARHLRKVLGPDQQRLLGSSGPRVPCCRCISRVPDRRPSRKRGNKVTEQRASVPAPT
ncbi:hypothetical protein VTJ83DRAFT_2860 [Remersonia thermophila]|uniref:Uncharacterized protein n=1 Tax=Remersonia thermophila TaxID=72144 RepID=A0ABR4DCD6_9PEZI